MLKRRTTTLASRISIDTGGYHTRLFSETEGLILDEPSIGLLDMDHQHAGSRAVSRFGLVAADLFESAPSGKRLINPLQSDCNNNVGHCPKMLGYFLKQANQEGLIGKSPIVLLALPSDITELQTDQLKHACFTSGASRVHLVDNGIAIALGAGLPIHQPKLSLLIDFGARGARLYAYANDEIIASTSIPCGGDLLTATLTTGIREHFGIQVSDKTAQDTKHRIGSATAETQKHQLRNSCQVHGLAISEHFDMTFSLSMDEAHEILKPAMNEATRIISAAIQGISARFPGQLNDTCITLTGGGAQLAHIDQLVRKATNLPVEIAKRPLSTAARGGALMLERIHGSLKSTETA